MLRNLKFLDVLVIVSILLISSSIAVVANKEVGCLTDEVQHVTK